MNFREKIGCIHKKGLRVFARTADGRYNISEELFFDTHFRMTLKQETNRGLEEWTEQDLLREIEEIEKVGVRGENRIYFLFGATGSGKSELSKWLEAKLAKTDRKDAVHRVSKTELEIPEIVRKFKKTLHLHEGFEEKERDRRRKKVGRMPKITAAKILYDALWDLQESDEFKEIMEERLLPTIAKGLQQGFSSEKGLEEEWGEFIEPLPQEIFEEKLRGTGVTEKLGYEELSTKLNENIEKILLEGTSLVGTLENLSKHIMEEMNTRPVLLIDDIVQSLNLYVVDLLDYFMDFKRGNWDVVIGITPAFLEKTKKGRELLTRITQQNTLRERVTNLLLTDRVGETSYVLDQRNCVDFIRPYLKAYKKQNGVVCDSTCKFYQNCRQLQPEDSTEDTCLAPFNSILLQRIFASLPKRTGKARTFTQKVSDLLDKMSEQEAILQVLEDHVESDIRVEYPQDTRVETVAEQYLPKPEEDTIQVPKRLLDFFEIDCGDEKGIDAPVISLTTMPEEHEEGVDVEPERDPRLVVINRWLDGKQLSDEERQQLFHLRNGVISLITDFVKPGELRNPHISNPSGNLCWKGKIQGTDPPVRIDGVDDRDGVEIDRSIGRTAFLLHLYGSGAIKEDDIKAKILTGPKFGSLLISGRRFRERCLDQISNQLGLNVEKLVLSLYLLSVGIHGPYEVVPPLSLDENTEKFAFVFNVVDPRLPYGLSDLDCRFTEYQVRQIKEMFDDFYKVRENFYDGYMIRAFLEEMDLSSLIKEVLSADEKALSRQFMVGSEPLERFLQSIKKKVEKLQDLGQYEKVINQFERFERLGKILNTFDEDTLDQVVQKLREIKDRYGDRFRYQPSMANLEYPKEECRGKINEIKKLFEDTRKHLYEPTVKAVSSAPLRLLRFLYAMGKLETYELVLWILKMDERLGRLEEHLKTKVQEMLTTEKRHVEIFKENLEEVEEAIIEFFSFRHMIVDTKLSLDGASIEEVLKPFVNEQKMTRHGGQKGYEEIKIVGDKTHVIRIYTDRSEFQKSLLQDRTQIGQNVNLVVIGSFAGPMLSLPREDLIKNILIENYGQVAVYFSIPIPNSPELMYYDTIRSPISFLITGAFRNLSLTQKAILRKFDLHVQEKEDDVAEGHTDKEEIDNELSLRTRASELLSSMEGIIEIETRCELFDDFTKIVDVTQIRTRLGWVLLSEFFDSEFNMEDQIRVWTSLLSKTIRSPFEISTHQLSEMRDELSRLAKKLEKTEDSQHSLLGNLLSDRRKYWEGIYLLKTKAPEIGQLFPVEREKIQSLIEMINSLDLFEPDEVYGLMEEATEVRKVLTAEGVKEGSLDYLKRGLSAEAFELILRLLMERRSIPLKEVEISHLLEIEKELPEIFGIIGLLVQRG